MSEIAIIGGGIGGLCAAHHLSRAGVQNIVVYEASDTVGGKARSQYPDNGNGGTYPGEHGFRFFPHFYRHLLQTLRQIETSDGSVYNRLVAPGFAAIAYQGDELLVVPRPEPLKPSFDLVQTAVEILSHRGIGLEDAARFASRLLAFATSCDARREHEYDNISWMKFLGAVDHPFSGDFENIVIRASQNLSAMRASESSAATIGAITLQLMFFFNDEKVDALLRGPTDELWLRDWQSSLRKRGVQFVFSKTLTRFEFDRVTGTIQSLRFGGETVTADYYVAALPLERLVAVLDADMMAFDSGLGALIDLKKLGALGNMTGLQFFLRNRVDIAHGHVHYPGTPFALTSISQGQFWATPPEQRPNTPELHDVISVIISNWDVPGTEGKTAREYDDRQALAREVWRQMKAALPAGTLDDGDIIASHLDTNITLGPFGNSSPLLVHPVGQRRLRPDAQTAISNLFLASDFVRTYTDLATMEGADEAARAATRAILAQLKVPEDRWPEVMPLDEGNTFAAAKALDRALFQLGIPHPMSVGSGEIKQAMGDIEHALGVGLLPALVHHLPHLGGLPPLHLLEDLTVEALTTWERFFKHQQT